MKREEFERLTAEEREAAVEAMIAAGETLPDEACPDFSGPIPDDVAARLEAEGLLTRDEIQRWNASRKRVAE